MKLARLTCVAALCGCVVAFAGGDGEFDVHVWTAETDPRAKFGSVEKYPLAKAVMVDAQTYKTNYYDVWMTWSGVDLLSFPPLGMRPGESTGMDISDTVRGTNRPVEKFPIPTHVPGVFVRFKAETNASPVKLHCEFVYNGKDDDAEGVTRKAHYAGWLTFGSNEVAVLRLPRTSHTIVSPRTIFGVPAGKRTTVKLRDVFLAVQVRPVASEK